MTLKSDFINQATGITALTYLINWIMQKIPPDAVQIPAREGSLVDQAGNFEHI
jgi:hypothetical protein